MSESTPGTRADTPTAPPTDEARLASYVAVWWQAVQDLTALLDDLAPEDWALPTDLAGWDVHACAAHVAHLESVLATGEEESADVGEPAHVTGVMGLYTEIGVVNRRERDPVDIVAEIRRSATARHARLRDNPPTDASATPDHVFGGMPWTWERLLRNRPLDVWMHEQDVRRATGRPGGLDGAPARHTIDYLLESTGYVLARKAGAPAGRTLVLEVEGHGPVACQVGEDGRGASCDVPATPSVRVVMDRDSFVRLAGGRCAAAPGRVRVEGDATLGARFVAAMATTP